MIHFYGNSMTAFVQDIGTYNSNLLFL